MIESEVRKQKSVVRRCLLIAILLALSGLLSCASEIESGDVVYLAKDQQGSYQLFRLSPANRNPTGQPVTDLDASVLDFTINDHQEIAFSVADIDPSSDIWFISPEIDEPAKIVDCQEFECLNPRWSPTLDLFIYERRPIIDGEVDRNRPTLWWYDLPTQQSVQVFADENWIGQDVRFSADGQSISYVVPLIDEAQIYNITTGEVGGISSRTGTPIEWGLDDDIYFSALLVQGERSQIHILRSDTSNSELIDLSGHDVAVEDSSYSVSPSGDRLVFTRKPPRASTGSQIWVMNTDGSEAKALTNDLSIQHGAVSWSSDSQQLIFQKFDIGSGLSDSPTIWMMDVATGSETPLGIGTRPQWVP